MIKTLNKKIVPYYSKLIKVVGNIYGIYYPSGISDNITIDILVNSSDILSSGVVLYFNDTTTYFIYNTTYMLYPKDLIEVRMNYVSGIKWDKINVKMYISQIIKD